MRDILYGLSRKTWIFYLIMAIAEIALAVFAAIFIKRSSLSLGLIILLLIIILLKDIVITKKILLPTGYMYRMLHEIAPEENIDIDADYRSRFSNITKIITNKSQSAMLLMQAEMYALQNQINPHFLYNTLETIRSMAVKRGADDISEMIEALSNIFRYEISKPGEMATLEEEVQNVLNYITIQKYRFGDKIDIVWKIEEEYQEIKTHLMPILTIQPIVENAIHHGLETKMGKGVVNIHIFCTSQRITIEIADNGIGISEEQLSKVVEIINTPISLEYKNEKRVKNRSGIALMNVNQRIKYYFGQEYGISIFSTTGIGTTVKLIMPIV